MTLVANGYDYDLVNDDLLQNHARITDSRLVINNHSRRILILPDVSVIPMATIQRIAQFAEAGGVVIALGRLPQMAAGLKDYRQQDGELQRIVEGIFGGDRVPTAHVLPDYKLGETVLDPFSQEWKPMPPLTADKKSLLDCLGKYAPPDMAIDDRRQSDGLTFVHTRVGEVDVYFVTNLQPNPIRTDATFNVTGKTVQRWDARTGQIDAAECTYTDRNGKARMEGTVIPLELSAWESAFYVFIPANEKAGELAPHVSQPQGQAPLRLLPAGTLNIAGNWSMRLEGHGFETYEDEIGQLASWTESPRTQHYSGTGQYDIEFHVPDEFASGEQFILDLGEVGMIAEVELNSIPVGTAWMPPYRLNVTEAIRTGRNRLTVYVTNVWLNYITGLTEPTTVPEELQERLGTKSVVFGGRGKRYEKLLSEMSKNVKQLPPSGLIGQVQINRYFADGGNVQ
jgi:hypothetical protein